MTTFARFYLAEKLKDERLKLVEDIISTQDEPVIYVSAEQYILLRDELMKHTCSVMPPNGFHGLMYMGKEIRVDYG